MKRQWLIQQSSADITILEEVSSLVNFHEERVVNNIKAGRARFGKVLFAVTPEDIMQKKAAIIADDETPPPT
jgi:hypothetical protein